MNLTKEELFYSLTGETTVLLEQLDGYVQKPTCTEEIIVNCVTKDEVLLIARVAEHLYSAVRVAYSVKDTSDTESAIELVQRANALAAQQIVRLKQNNERE